MRVRLLGWLCCFSIFTVSSGEIVSGNILKSETGCGCHYSFEKFKYETTVYDHEMGKRPIPIVVYGHNQSNQYPVVMINHGYGVKHTEYSFIAKNLAAQGYCVVSMQHDLEGDPPLEKSGNIYQKRMSRWARGVRSLELVIKYLEKRNPGLDLKQIILIGHSNGGDMSMMFADKYPNKVNKVISLDSLRYPFPSGVDILSLRSNDRVADRGVLNNKVTIIQMGNAKHIDMCDQGPDLVKKEILHHMNAFLHS